MVRKMSFAVMASAAAYFVSSANGYQAAIFITKPLTTALILVMAAGSESRDLRYKYAVVAGLVCSIAGDVLLLFDDRLFLQGLLAFLVAHLCYIIAFTSQRKFFRASAFTALVALYAFITAPLLWPHLGSLRIPVAVYMAVILTMLWQAVERWAEARN